MSQNQALVGRLGLSYAHPSSQARCKHLCVIVVILCITSSLARSKLLRSFLLIEPALRAMGSHLSTTQGKLPDYAEHLALVGRLGFEPRTRGLKGPCSAN
jgi:hypothetical protein